MGKRKDKKKENNIILIKGEWTKGNIERRKKKKKIILFSSRVNR
jgi:hypothetical protein